eukprot:jgi/Botrbrau1/19241/Bobra.0077s0138.2
MAGKRPRPWPSSTAAKEPHEESSNNPEPAFHQEQGVPCSSCMRSNEYAKPKDLGELRALPHELLEHVLPGLPQATICGLSTSSRHCREAARKAMPHVRAALVASLKDGCKWASPAQLQIMTTMLQHFKACRHINMDQPVPVVGHQGGIVACCVIGPTGKVLPPGSKDIDPSQLRETYGIEWPYGRAIGQYLTCDLVFRLSDRATLWFRLDVIGGRVLRQELVGSCYCCQDVDLFQGLLLKLWPSWGGGELRLSLPVKSIRECAAIVAGCGHITWAEGAARERHLSADASCMESSIGWECSKIEIKPVACVHLNCPLHSGRAASTMQQSEPCGSQIEVSSGCLMHGVHRPRSYGRSCFL